MDWVLTHLDEPLTVEQLARRSGVSVRTLHRQLVTGPGSKPLDWLNSQRVGRAQTAAGNHRPTNRTHRHRLWVRQRRYSATALPSNARHQSGRLPPHVHHRGPL